MDDQGRIHQLSEEESKKVEARIVQQKLKGQRVRMTSISPQYFEFFASKGQAFRALWAKRMIKGMSVEDSKRLHTMVEEFHKTEEPS